MTKFKDFEAFINTLDLPFRGKTYSIPEVGASTGAKYHMQVAQARERQRIAEENERAFAEAEEAGETPPEPTPLPDAPDEPTNEELLGDVLETMLEDDVPASVIRAAAMTAYYDFMVGRDAALVYWNSGGDPKALEKFVEQLRTSMESMAAENTTQKPDSTSGTKPRTKKSQSATGAASKSTTRKSSKTGAPSKARSKKSTE